MPSSELRLLYRSYMKDPSNKAELPSCRQPSLWFLDHSSNRSKGRKFCQSRDTPRADFQAANCVAQNDSWHTSWWSPPSTCTTSRLSILLERGLAKRIESQKMRQKRRNCTGIKSSLQGCQMRQTCYQAFVMGHQTMSRTFCFKEIPQITPQRLLRSRITASDSLKSARNTGKRTTARSRRSFTSSISGALAWICRDSLLGCHAESNANWQSAPVLKSARCPAKEGEIVEGYVDSCGVCNGDGGSCAVAAIVLLVLIVIAIFGLFFVWFRFFCFQVRDSDCCAFCTIAWFLPVAHTCIEVHSLGVHASVRELMSIFLQETAKVVRVCLAFVM